MFISCGEKYGRDHLLNIVSMDPTVLVRVLFSKEEQRQQWFNLLRENTVITAHRAASLQQQQHNQQQRAQRMASSSLAHRPGTGATSAVASMANGAAATMTTTTTSATAAAAAAVPPPSPRGPSVESNAGTISPRRVIRKLSPDSRSLSHEPDSGLFTSSGSPRSVRLRGVGSHHKARSSAAAAAAAAGPLLDTSDSAGSIDDLVSPVDRLHMTINQINRLIEQIRPVLLESGLDPPESHLHSQQAPTKSSMVEGDTESGGDAAEKPKVNNMDDLVMLLFDLTREWLGCLSRTVAQTYHQRRGSSLVPLEADREDVESTGPETTGGRSPQIPKRSGSFNMKRQSSLSWTAGSDSTSVKESAVKSSTPPAGPGQSVAADYRRPSEPNPTNVGSLTLSTPNLLQFEAPPPLPGSGARPTVVMKVHDLRRSKRGRTARSISMSKSRTVTESERAFADRIELLASKLVHAVRQYKQMTAASSSAQDEAETTAELPVRSGTTPLEYMSDEDRAETDSAEQSELDYSEPLADCIPAVVGDENEVNNDEEERVSIGCEQASQLDENEEAFTQDEASSKADTLRPSAEKLVTTTATLSRLDTQPKNGTPESDTRESDDPTSSTLSAGVEAMADVETDTISAATLSSSGGIRDSGSNRAAADSGGGGCDGSVIELGTG
ncbi:unnamed protein product [Echinostoma caproni]|uniref:PH domain-containing protein n=1 Tax=Echinostoma caproni TaxID=27848 RepID=A0A183AFB4_9TREM|nr:unnamed protein product [Echinostoma caproni]